MNELHPCSCCERAKAVAILHGEEGFSVNCSIMLDGCGWSTSDYPTIEEAVYIWNKSFESYAALQENILCTKCGQTMVHTGSYHFVCPDCLSFATKSSEGISRFRICALNHVEDLIALGYRLVKE